MKSGGGKGDPISGAIGKNKTYGVPIRTRLALYNAGLSPYGSRRSLYNAELSPYGSRRSLYNAELSPYGSRRSLYNAGLSPYKARRSLYALARRVPSENASAARRLRVPRNLVIGRRADYKTGSAGLGRKIFRFQIVHSHRL